MTKYNHTSTYIHAIFSLFKQAILGKEHDFTQGNLKRAVFMLSIPMILEMLFESVFALVDAFFVSRVSVNAIATVGLTESVLTLVYAVAIGLSMSATAMVARRIGENEPEKANETAVQVIFLGVVLAVLISAVGIVYPKELLELMGGSPELIAEGYGYTQIVLGGNITVMLLFLINAVFRGAGNASIAMWTLIVSNVLNMILDPLLIFGWGPIPAYGLEGAAIATTTGRGVAVVLQLGILFFGSGKIKLSLRALQLQLALMLQLLRVSIGGIGQFLIGTSSWVFLMRMISEFGSEVLAGYTIAIRIMLFTLMPAWGMSNAAATLVGQNLGAKQPERAEQSVWITSKYCAWFMGLVSLVYLVGATEFLALFSSNATVIENGALCLRVMAIGYIAYAYGMVTIQSFNGAGDTITPTIINFVCFWLFQLPFAYAVAIYFDYGPKGVFWSITLAEVLIAIIGVLWFRKGNWKQVKV